jgi:hypothetical protein
LLKITRGKRSLLEKQSFLCLGCLSEATLLWNLPDAKQREPFSRLSSDIFARDLKVHRLLGFRGPKSVLSLALIA